MTQGYGQGEPDDLPRHPDDDRMREEVKGDELYIKKEARIHPWVYTIIPIQTNLASESMALFTAYCKACRSYFTERIPYDVYRGQLTKASIPRYGCEPISQDVSVL